MSRWRQSIACDILIAMIADRWARRLFAARNGAMCIPANPLAKTNEVIDELKSGIAETSDSIAAKGRLWAYTSFPPTSEASVEGLRQSIRFVHDTVIPPLQTALTSRDASSALAALKAASEHLDKEHGKYHAIRDRAKGLSWPGVFQTARLALNSRIAIGISSAVVALVLAAFGVWFPKELERHQKEQKLRVGLQQRSSSLNQQLRSFEGKSESEKLLVYSNVFALVVGDPRNPIIDPEFSVGILVNIQRLGYECHCTNGLTRAESAALELTRYVSSIQPTNFSVSIASNLIESISQYSRIHPIN